MNPLIRKEKVIVYMDDVLIPTVTVEQNLEILEEIMITLRKYSFELNYNKCQFLKRQIEFLGYVVSGQGITLKSEAHRSNKKL